jgi:hypothetical protein
VWSSGEAERGKEGFKRAEAKLSEGKTFSKEQ